MKLPIQSLPVDDGNQVAVEVSGQLGGKTSKIVAFASVKFWFVRLPQQIER